MDLRRILLSTALSLGMVGCVAVPDVVNADLLAFTNGKLARLSLPPAKDGRQKFAATFCTRLAVEGPPLGHSKSCDKYLADAPIQLANGPASKQPERDVRLVLIGGIFNQCVDRKINLLSDSVAHAGTSKIAGLRSLKPEYLQISGYSSSETNAKLIAEALAAIKLHQSEKLVLVSYSKGTSDLITALGRYPKASANVDSVISIAGVVLGTPLANNKQLLSKILQMSNTSCRGPDGQGLESLKPEVRQSFLQQNALPQHINYYSLAGAASRSQTSPVHHPFWNQVAQDSGAADGQVPSENAVIPGSTLLGFMKADHWAMAMPFDTKTPLLAKTIFTQNRFPRQVMLAATLEVVLSDLAN